ncbi:MAG: hypothetical protein C4537_07210 [Acholeplasma sp.]|jgi:succinate-acetate transporter protein|nr:MAG: hypothetical protein C4537_07210 [Acholeplasma sp.]
MNPFTIIVLILSSLGLLGTLYLAIIKKKRAWFISSFFFVFGLLMIILGQTVSTTGGSFADVIYTVFGVFSLIIALISALITWAVQARKASKQN